MAQKGPLNIAQLAAQEEEREANYRRMEQEQFARR